MKRRVQLLVFLEFITSSVCSHIVQTKQQFLFREEGKTKAKKLAHQFSQLQPWAGHEPDSGEYNEETHVPPLPISVEQLFAIIYCLCLSSTPVLLAALAEEKLTRTHLLESAALVTWLGLVFYFFCNVLIFQSIHWDGLRPLTLVETVYVLSQIFGTVGYGDIQPAYPRSQVFVGINVMVALFFYGSCIKEVILIVQRRITKAMDPLVANSEFGQPVKNWVPKVNTKHMVKTCVLFLFMLCSGVLFYWLWPGENKTFIQSVYMSIVTLSTIGFGDYVADTVPGKIFGAFWMPCGIGALTAVIGGFAEWMQARKRIEGFYLVDHKAEFKALLAECSDHKGRMNRCQFLEFMVRLTKDVDRTSVNNIKDRYRFLLQEGQTFVRMTTAVDAEGPPL